MKTLEFTGLDQKKVNKVVEGLSQLLADLQVFYSNLRGFHWNVKGKGFFHLHEKYEEYYDDVADKVDEVAERILQLGATPENRHSEYLKVANVKEDGFDPSGREGMEKVVETLSVLISQERKVLQSASEAGDEVTVSLMSDYLKEQEKKVWMIVSFLSKKPV